MAKKCTRNRNMSEKTRENFIKLKNSKWLKKEKKDKREDKDKSRTHPWRTGKASFAKN
jgi:hypothetical protein